MHLKNRPRFFDQVGHQTNDVSFGYKHFLLNNDIVRLTKIMINLVKDLKILIFKVIFQWLSMVEHFPKKNSVKSIWLAQYSIWCQKRKIKSISYCNRGKVYTWFDGWNSKKIIYSPLRTRKRSKTDLKSVGFIHFTK